MSRLIRFCIVTGWKPFVLCLLAGCAPRMPRPSAMSGAFGGGADVVGCGSSLSVLPWLGGIATLGGIVALVLTRGGMGIRAIIVGVLLVILNDIMHRYATAFYIPILVGTAGVSLAYAWKTIRRATQERKKCTSGKSSHGPAPDTSAESSRRRGSRAPSPAGGKGDRA